MLLAGGAIAVGFVIARSSGPGERDVPTERADSSDRDPAVATLAPGARGGVLADEPAAPRRYRVGSNARALVGRVVARADGRAIAGAVVTSEVTGVLGDETATTTTDAQGAFRVAVPGESATLRIAAPGYAPVERFGVVPQRELLVRLSPAPRLVGRVVNEQGAPVAGVTVRTRAGGGATARVVGETTSDADGRFALEGLPIGVVRVEARGRGWVPFLPPSVSVPPDRDRTVPLEPGRTTDVTLVVARGVDVRGRVLDADGTPVADAPVWCEARYGDPDLTWSGEWPAPSRHDRRGRCVRRLVALPWRSVLRLGARGGRAAGALPRTARVVGRADSARSAAVGAVLRGRHGLGRRRRRRRFRARSST